MTVRSGVIALLGALALVAATARASADVKVGFHAPVTGFAAADGKSAEIAAKLAVEDINASGGLAGQPVTLVVYDDQAQPAQTISVANKLIHQDGVTFAVSGSYSEPTRAAATLFQESSIPYIAAYASHPAITAAGSYVFRSFVLGPPQGAAAARFIGGVVKAKRVVAIAVDNDYGQTAIAGLKDEATKAGLDLVSVATFGMKDRQFGPIVAGVKRDKPDAIYVAGYFFHAAPLASQLRAAGVTATIVGMQGLDSQELMSIAGPAANGIYVVNGLNRDNPEPKFKSFMDRLAARGGGDSQSVATAVYSAFLLLQNAVNRAGSLDRAMVVAALATTRNFPHFSGMLESFDDRREARMKIPVNLVKDGVFTFVGNAD